MVQIQLFFSVILIVFNVQLARAQESENLDSLYNEIEFLIGDSWYLVETKEGFSVTFCRTCTEEYFNYLDTMMFPELKRGFFFKSEKIDSVAYFPTVSSYNGSNFESDEEEIKFFTEYYKPDAILQFEIVLQKKWSKEYYELAQSKNDLLEKAIRLEPLYKTSPDIFLDYRFWIPGDFFKRRTLEFDYYFERLPYESELIDKSVFVLHNMPYFFSAPILVDKADEEFFAKRKNLLENEGQRVLKIIALVLKLDDFNITN